MERLFGDLHHRLTELVEKCRAGLDTAGLDTAGLDTADNAELDEPSSADQTRHTIEITRPRALSQGVEFTLIGPAYACRFVNTMTGFLRVGTHSVENHEPGPESVRADVLSVHPYWGTFRPILKPLRSRGGPGATRRTRTAFCYTSAEELAAHYLDLVRGD